MVYMSGAKALVESLKREKVDVIFGIPGGATLTIYDVLYDYDIRHILARHEQCAAHMADGYARALREERRAGVCSGTSGPGSTNLITGIATAMMDSSPVIAITGQVPTSMIGRDAFQETDMIGVSMPITKYNFQPRRPEEIPETVKKAFYIATTGRPGPVVIDVPKDVQIGEAEMEFPDMVEIRGYLPEVKPDPLKIKRAKELLLNAERPIILAGGGVLISGATRELVALAELLQTPVATTLMGKGAIPENHPLSLGPIGMHGRPAANKLVIEADLILAVGMRFSDRTVGRFEDFGVDAKLIHVDIDQSELEKNVEVDLTIVGDAKAVLSMLLEEVMKSYVKGEETLWAKRVREVKEEFRELKLVDGKGAKPAKVLKKARELLPSDALVTTEVGQCQMWASLHFDVLKPNTFLTSGGLGTMGFGFPAAIGAKVAKPDVPVMDIAGDGSFGMTENSLATSVTENIPVIVLILDNRALGMIVQWQRMFYGRRYMASDLKGIPDFVKLAQAYGAQGIRAESVEDAESALRYALKSDVTTVIDLIVSPEEDVLPFVAPGSSLREMIL